MGKFHQHGSLVPFLELWSAVYAVAMSSDPTFRENRRSARVPLKISIKIEGGTDAFEGETIIVNLHGALISVTTSLKVGMRISVHVFLTGKHAGARVVFVNPDSPTHCGIELDHPLNIWGVSLPPDDWDETAVR
jgi:hypothetical protein